MVLRRLYLIPFIVFCLILAAVFLRPGTSEAAPGTFVYTGNLGNNGYAAYALPLYAGETVVATETCNINAPGGLDPRMWVFRPDFSQLAANDDGYTTWPCAGFFAARITFTVPADGTYYFVAGSWNNNPPAGYTLTITVTGVDTDGDGYTRGIDCNDNNASIHPGAFDTPGDGIDQNCDGHDAHTPVAVANAYSTFRNAPLTVVAPGVLGNDTDVDADPLTAVLVSTTANGTLTLNPNGSFTYTPNLNFVGTDTFQYRANDGQLNSNIVTVTITVINTNTAPVANNNNYTTPEDVTLNIAAPGVLGNDTDVNNDPLTAILVTTTTNGTLTLSANGSFSYVPNPNFSGTDTFTYRANDSFVNSGIATVTITVTTVNDAPVATDDVYSTPFNTTLNVPAIGVLSNDTDVDNVVLTTVLVATTTNGALTLNANGSFTYIPNPGFNGSDTFTYRARDGSLNSNIATVTINVGPNTPPVANNDSYTTSFNTALIVPAPGVITNDTDANGTPLTAVLAVGPTNGILALSAAGSFTYTPAPGFTGTDSFTYFANDGVANSPTAATVTITVTPNNAPVATGDSYSTPEDSGLTIAAPGVLSNDTDADGNPLSAVLVTSPANGTLTLNANGSFTYTPNPNFNGSDGFIYFATDGSANSANVNVVILVTPVNDAPVAVNDLYGTPFNTPRIVAVPGVLGNDTDVDGNTITAVLALTTTNGTLALSANGAFTYTPTVGFSGTDSFTYFVFDGTVNSATAATVTINVGTNTAPVANNDVYSTPFNTTLNIAAAGVLINDTDADGDPITAGLVLSTLNGSLTLNPDGSFSYAPNPGFSGSDTFTYNANDGTVDSAVPATVTINVGINTPPVATNNIYNTPFNTPLTITPVGILANDTDLDGDALTALLSAGAFNGSLTLNPDGSFTYTPNITFSGSDTFIYYANDGTVNSAVSAIVTIIVGPNPNVAPVANNDAFSTPMSTTLNIAAAGVLSNDTDGDGDPLTAVPASGPANGSLTLNADGSFSYIPTVGFIGTDTFTYFANDGTVNSGTAATVTITVTAIPNSAPVANNDAYSTPMNTTLNIVLPGILGNDTDADGDPLTAIPVSGPASGLLTLNADGSFSYTPTVGFSGTDTFTYNANDGTANSAAPATVTITVTAAGNTPPVANNDAYSTPVNTTLTIPPPGVLGNDSDADGNPLTAVLVSSPTNGVLTLNTDGSFTYLPNPGFNGTDIFTYQANDGAANSAAATVRITVGTAPITPAAVAIPLPEPPPAPLCTLTNFENPGMIRSHFTNDVDREELYCRLIAANGSYFTWLGSPLTSAANIGNKTVLDLGLVAAVDVFSLRGVTGFVGDVDICLKGRGYMIFMNVSGAPRVPQLWSAWTTDAFPGYTCTTLYAPGTVILVSQKP